MGGYPSSSELSSRRPGDSWSCADAINEVRASHRFTVEKFSLVCRNKMKIESRTFAGGPSEWHLELETTDHYVELALFLDKPAEVPMSVDYKASILDRQMKKHTQTETFSFQSVTAKSLIRKVSLIEQDQLLKSQAKQLLVGDRLTILCELYILLPVTNKSTLMLPPVTPPHNNLGADLGSLLQRCLHSDVILVTEEREFKAHKNILSARSPVFEVMFQHDMKETKETKYIHINAFSADIVEKMLQYIYTGEVSNLEWSAEKLLEAAGNYNLESLKSLCEVLLCHKVEVNNAARLLMLADKHLAAQLKSDCMNFIVAHPKEVQETDGWKILENEQLDLLFEVSKKLLI